MYDMTTSTVIGRTTFVRGRINGAGDLEIAGRVEGDVTCTGEVVIEAEGMALANISAGRIVVRGAVKGDLTAEEMVVVESRARIVGDLRAPRIAIAAGGLVRGLVETGGGGAGARPRAATAVRAPETKARAVSAPPTARAAQPLPPLSAPKARAATNHKGPPRGAALAGARVGPPPPVVPVLKKGTKAVQKKRG
jgi:cytoskeletal protein CcmA (bactofilin family)